MAKELDDLLRDVFGSGKSRTFSTQRAETYLEQSRKMNDGLDAIQKKQENLNQKLQDQLAELKKMSGELDFDAIQKEVEKDFGVTYQQKAPAKPETTVKETDSRPEAQRFGDLLPKLSGQLIGQDAFLKKLVIAFKRPYIMGWEKPEGLRNAILVHGKPNTGRHTALDLVAEGMAEAGLLASGKVQTLQTDYAATVFKHTDEEVAKATSEGFAGGARRPVQSGSAATTGIVHATGTV